MIHHPMHCDGADGRKGRQELGVKEDKSALIHTLMVRVPHFAVRLFAKPFFFLHLHHIASGRRELWAGSAYCLP